MPLSVLNRQFSGPRTARFGPRTFVLHRFSFIFGRCLCFITRKVTGGWEASNCCSNQLYILRRPPAPVFRTSGLMLNTLEPFSSNPNHIFVMYTHGRTLKVYGRPLIPFEPFEPLLKMACSLSCFRVSKFEPQGCEEETWEATNMWWPATKATWPF